MKQNLLQCRRRLPKRSTFHRAKRDFGFLDVRCCRPSWTQGSEKCKQSRCFLDGYMLLRPTEHTWMKRKLNTHLWKIKSYIALGKMTVSEMYSSVSATPQTPIDARLTAEPRLHVCNDHRAGFGVFTFKRTRRVRQCSPGARPPLTVIWICSGCQLVSRSEWWYFLNQLLLCR